MVADGKSSKIEVRKRRIPEDLKTKSATSYTSLSIVSFEQRSYVGFEKFFKRHHSSRAHSLAGDG